MPRLFKSLILTLLLAAALALLLFGPRPSRATPDGFITITYWEKWSGEEAQQMSRIVDDFNETVGKQKHIHVRFISLSNISQKTLLATAAGDPPDVAGMYDQQVCQWASLDALEPLDQWAAQRGITAADYKPGYWAGCRYRGHLWALVSTPAAMALLYNKRIFYENAGTLRAAGLDPGRAPRTLSELDRYAAALDRFTVDSSGNRRLQRAGFLPAQSWYLDSIVYWFGGRLFDETRDQLNLTLPQNIEAYRWLQSYTLRLGASAMSDFTGGLAKFDTPQNPFIIGKEVMQQQGPWMANTIFRRAPAMSQRLVPWSLELYLPTIIRPFNYDWGVAPFPSDLPGNPELTVLGFDVLCIPRTAHHKPEAFEFIAYVQSQSVMEKLCTMHCKNSVLSRVSSRFINLHPNPYIDVFERLSADPAAPSFPRTGLWPEIHDELVVAGQAIATLDPAASDPAAVLVRAQRRLQPKLDRFRAAELRDHPDPSIASK